MPTDYLKTLSTIGTDHIVMDLVSKQLVGIGVWNLTKEKFTVVEDITGFDQKYYSTMIEFVEEIVNPLDKSMVLSELKNYIEYPEETYQSTFRLRTNEVSPRWVTFKGNKMQAASTGDDLFYIVILNVTDGNFVTGNDKRTDLLEEDFFIKQYDCFAI